MTRAFAALALIAPCKSKPAPEPGVASGSAPAPVVTSGSAQAPVEVTLEPGDVELGCLGYSPALQRVACVMGEKSAGGAKLALYVTGQTAVVHPLDDTLDADAASDASKALAGFVPLTATPTTLVAGTKTDIGGGVTLEQITTDSKVAVYASCGATRTLVKESAGEGLSLTTAWRPVPAGTLVEMRFAIAREGEHSEEFVAELVLPDCRVK